MNHTQPSPLPHALTFASIEDNWHASGTAVQDSYIRISLIPLVSFKNISPMKWIYKITYPNGKIYVGKDLTGTFRYFGSPNSKLLEQDFTEEERDNFSITRSILWKSAGALDEDVNKMEVQFILELQSNDPRIGYNQWPKMKAE